jgi:hypothetical protein
VIVNKFACSIKKSTFPFSTFLNDEIILSVKTLPVRVLPETKAILDKFFWA